MKNQLKQYLRAIDRGEPLGIAVLALLFSVLSIILIAHSATKERAQIEKLQDQIHSLQTQTFVLMENALAPFAR